MNFVGLNENHYTYHRLAKGEMRLFMLFPGQEGDPIRGIIFTVSSIDNAGPYRTLSYEWGKKHEEMKIYTDSGVLTVWKALHDTLVHLREKSPYVLWIDAICINQKDNAENTDQIRLLPKIFQYARRTPAFLASDDDSHDVIRTLLQISYKRDTSRLWPGNLGDVPKHWRNLSKPAMNDPVWQDVKFFFDRTWFRRAWIVQKAVAAPTVTIVCL
jgi:hypothetical protein